MTQSSSLGAVQGGQSGALVRSAFNAAIQALASECEGSSAPSPTYPFLRWRNDAARRLYRRNAADSGWQVEENYGATTDPTTGDDADDGYVRGARWINTAASRLFVCLDPAPNAAVWVQLTAAGVFQSTDAGAGEGPTLSLDRNSASPAANDLLGAIAFLARSSAAVQRTAGKLAAQLLDPANGSEDAQLLLQTMVAGALATRLSVGQGLVVGSGSDPGGGLVNAENGFQRAGVALPLQRVYVSSPATITPNTVHYFAHGLGVTPKLVQVRFRCVTPDLGYAVGDEVVVNNATAYAGATVGKTIWFDSSQVYVRICNNTAQDPMIAKDGSGFTYCLAARWNLVVSAWG